MAHPHEKTPIPASEKRTARVRAAGKFFAKGPAGFFINGISYGPFRPNSKGEPFPEAARLQSDLQHIRSLGFNTARTYGLPSETFLSAAQASDLQILVGLPWTDHVDFLSNAALKAGIEQSIRLNVERLAQHPCVAAFLVGNEIEKTLVRWMGPSEVREFLEHLIELGKSIAPDVPFSYATYPSTEYLIPRNADFVSVNVYLEERSAWESYLRRLQNLAGNRPLVISEFGLDTLKHGNGAQAEMMTWQRTSLIKAGAAGGVWFSYTDEWWRGGQAVRGWHFGIVDEARMPKAACEIASALPTTLQIPARELSHRISVIVCTRNGAPTLRPCLDALSQQSYPNYEVLVIDDGSTDATVQITQSFPNVRCISQKPAGLSVARNLGAQEASGEILAYTDDDCIPHSDWLLRLSLAYDEGEWVAAGGPNIPPPPRTPMEALVASAPGAPTHVLIQDEEAEHLPGCNLSVRKSALLSIGGFHPDFTTAGDDVDICWRLREAGGKLRFIPGAMVWHHRRFTARAYLRQQIGYGKAEALLMKHHPSRFGPLGGARWRGAIYGDGLGIHDPSEGSIYHGPFGFAPFQAIYPQGIMAWWDLFSGVLWVALSLLALALHLPLLALLLLVWSVWAAKVRMDHNGHIVQRLSVADRARLGFLCWIQPIAREWARLRGMLRLHSRPSWHPSLPEIIIPQKPNKSSLRRSVQSFWSETGVAREQWLDAMRGLLNEKGIPFRDDDGWRRFDIEMRPSAILSWAFLTVTEYHGGNRTLTRVAVVSRIRKTAFGWLLFAYAALAVVGSRALTPLGFEPNLAIAAVILVHFTFIFLWPLMGCISLIHQAAERIGLKRLAKGNAPPSKSTTSLAAAEESCQTA